MTALAELTLEVWIEYDFAERTDPRMVISLQSTICSSRQNLGLVKPPLEWIFFELTPFLVHDTWKLLEFKIFRPIEFHIYLGTLFKRKPGTRFQTD